MLSSYEEMKIFPLKKKTEKQMHNELKRGKKIHFHGTMLYLPQKLKSTFFEKNSNGVSPEGRKN